MEQIRYCLLFVSSRFISVIQIHVGTFIISPTSNAPAFKNTRHTRLSLLRLPLAPRRAILQPRKGALFLCVFNIRTGGLSVTRLSHLDSYTLPFLVGRIVCFYEEERGRRLFFISAFFHSASAPLCGEAHFDRAYLPFQTCDSTTGLPIGPVNARLKWRSLLPFFFSLAIRSHPCIIGDAGERNSSPPCLSRHAVQRMPRLSTL